MNKTETARLLAEQSYMSGWRPKTLLSRGKARLGDLAIGIKPVNEAIIKILGYDLQVFDVANSCNQGSVEALSDMRPT